MLFAAFLTLVGILATFYVYFRQKQKGELEVKTEIKKEPFNPNSSENSNWVFTNSDGDRAINITIKVKSHHDKPLEIGPYILGVPKFQKLTSLNFVLPNWPKVDNIPLAKKKESIDLLPGEEAKEIYDTGYNIAQILNEKGYSGDLFIMFGVFDENKNAYYSEIIPMNIDEWERDKGQFIFGTIPF